jgi:hypothetical protein
MGMVSGRFVSGGFLQEGGFNASSATLAPVGGSHFLDEGVFDIVRAEALYILLHEIMEALRIFAGQDDDGGAEGLTHGVEGGALLALGSFGAV